MYTPENERLEPKQHVNQTSIFGFKKVTFRRGGVTLHGCGVRFCEAGADAGVCLAKCQQEEGVFFLGDVGFRKGAPHDGSRWVANLQGGEKVGENTCFSSTYAFMYQFILTHNNYDKKGMFRYIQFIFKHMSPMDLMG